MSPSQDSFGDGSSQFSQMSGMEFGVTSPSVIASPTSKVAFGWGTPPGEVKNSQGQYESLESPLGTNYYTAIADSPVESTKGLSTLTAKTNIQRRSSSPEVHKREIYHRQQSDHSVKRGSPNMHSPHKGSPRHRPSCEPSEQATRKVVAQTREASLSLLMQQSVDKGMATVMNRAISEQSPKPLVHPRVSPQPRSKARAASPLTIHSFPPSNEVFTPHRPKGAARNQAMGNRYGITQHHQKPDSEKLTHWERNGSVTDATEPIGEFKSTTFQSQSGKTHETTSSVSHLQDYQTNVLFEAQLTTHPTFGCSLGLYPAFAQRDYFSSQMEPQESLSSVLQFEQPKSASTSHSSSSSSRNDPGRDAPYITEEESSKQRYVRSKTSESTPQKKDTSCDISPTAASLISPVRRSKLIEQAAEKIKLKKSHSYNLDDRRRDTKEGDTNSSGLVSPSKRSGLIEQAALSLRQRRTKTLKLPQKSANQEKDDSSISLLPPPRNPTPSETANPNPLETADPNPLETANPNQLETANPNPLETANQEKDDSSISLLPPPHTQNPLETASGESDQMEEREFLKCVTNSDTTQISHSSAITALTTDQSQFQDHTSSESDHSDVIPKPKTHRRQHSLGSVHEEKHPPPSVIGTRWHNHYGSLGSVHTPPPPTKRLSDHDSQQYPKTFRHSVIGVGLQPLDASQKSPSYVDIPQHKTTQVRDIIDSDLSSLDRTSTRYKSLEALSSPHREILYTPSTRRRPVTLIVCRRHVSSSALSLTAAAVGATSNLRRISEPGL